MGQSQQATTENEFKQNFKQSFEAHVEEQSNKVQKHVDHLKKLMDKRRILQFLDDDDLEDERGARFDKENTKSQLHTFDGVQGWLTNDGVESLEVCI